MNFTLFDLISLQSDNRFNKMISSTANYISSIVIDGSYIGLVEFSSAAYVLSDLTFVTSDDDRQALLQSLPDPPGGGTGIGGGLLKAIEVRPPWIIHYTKFFSGSRNLEI